MKIIVCIKQVPDTTEIKIDPKTGTLIRKGVPAIINPDDMHALEEALRIKERLGAHTIALSMGPPQAEEALREALAMGIDDAVLLSHRSFAGADTLATSYTLGKAIETIGDFDLVICGRQAIDGDTAQIGPQLAEFLGIPQITYVRRVELTNGGILAERALEDGYERIETRLPALITVVSELNKPRYPSLVNIMKAFRKSIEVWGVDDVQADRSHVGLQGSATQVLETITPEWASKVEMIPGPPKEAAEVLIKKLRQEKIITV